MTAAEQARDRVETTGPAQVRPHFTGFESLRALAAVMVVVHHAASIAGPARAGRVATPAAVMDGGVAVFFVLSGFLIYRPFVRSLVDDQAAPSPVGFWWRRLLRIVPAYWVVLSFFWFIGSIDLGTRWWWHYLLLQPYSRSTALEGIVPAWSLSTEMTFYVLVPLWSLLVAALVRGRSTVVRRRAALVGCAALWAGGPISRATVDFWAAGRQGLAFQWLPTNLDLFATGMALAVLSVGALGSPSVRAPLDRIGAPVWPWWSAALAVFAWYAYRIGGVDLATGYIGWYWQRRQFAWAAFSVFLLFPAVFGDQSRGLARRVWAWRPLVWVGTVSYGLYLWHLGWLERSVTPPANPLTGRAPWIGWVDSPYGDSSFAYLLVVGLGLGLASAAMSWYLLERPLQQLKSVPERFRGALGRHRSAR